MIPGVRLVVLGKQGAGKGTQALRLSHHYVVPHVSTGDMLRAAVKLGTPLGLRAQQVMDRGDLLSDGLSMEMVSERLSESAMNNALSTAPPVVTDWNCQRRSLALQYFVPQRGSG